MDTSACVPYARWPASSPWRRGACRRLWSCGRPWTRWSQPAGPGEAPEGVAHVDAEYPLGGAAHGVGEGNPGGAPATMAAGEAHHQEPGTATWRCALTMGCGRMARVHPVEVPAAAATATAPPPLLGPGGGEMTKKRRLWWSSGESGRGGRGPGADTETT